MAKRSSLSSFWNRLLRAFRILPAEPEPAPRPFQLPPPQGYRKFDMLIDKLEIDPELRERVRQNALLQGRPENEFAAELIHFALEQALAQQMYIDNLLEHWETLTPRQRQAVALMCKGLTTRQIAEIMGVSSETVKSHLRTALQKFSLHNRAEMRLLLGDWDLSPWENIEE